MVKHIKRWESFIRLQSDSKVYVTQFSREHGKMFQTYRKVCCWHCRKIKRRFSSCKCSQCLGRTDNMKLNEVCEVNVHLTEQYWKSSWEQYWKSSSCIKWKNYTFILRVIIILVFWAISLKRWKCSTLRFFHNYSLIRLYYYCFVRQPISYESPINPTCTHLVLNKAPQSFQNNFF